MEKKKSKNILLAIMGVLILAELIISILSLLGGQDNVLLCAGDILVLVSTALYGFWLYKKPHGNMLKYTLLLFAVINVFNAADCLHLGRFFYIHTLRLFISCIICYVSGRLNRIEQNKYLLIFAEIAFFALTIITAILYVGIRDTIVLCRYSSETFVLLTLIIAYFVRYKEHREAGLTDAPKK